MNSITANIDGACKGNPGKGGWGYVVSDGFRKNGGKKYTTNGEMELTALYECLLYLSTKNYKHMTVHGDAKWIMDALNKRWICKWELNDWKKYNKKEVAHKHIWKNISNILYGFRNKSVVVFKWISRDKNKEADAEANKGVYK
ncbi:hypothetical protein CYY_000959 [Polysphondylium violaceum]|uniref:RNase H type-1 domain-containing protein n=1 Tax=Polysphondylium violaceum TaxID=133409 RepID=A0A8J4Q3V3_9MYCE|nr:hypothetical protein CYY_000959 [Polysphondylium violaceum]